MVIGILLKSPGSIPLFTADLYITADDDRLVISSDASDDVELRMDGDGRLVLVYPASSQVNAETIEVVLAHLEGV